MWSVYAYVGCDTCRKALRFLSDRGIPHTVIPIREQPPAKAELRRMLKLCDGEIRRLFNTSGQDFRAMGLGKQLPTLSENAAIELLAGNGKLVKRPFVLTPTGGTVGFAPEAWTRLATK